MSNATQDSRNNPGERRRRRSRGGRNRNNNQNNNNQGERGERGERRDRGSRGNNQGQGQSHGRSNKAEEFRPQSGQQRPARTYAPPKRTFIQKILGFLGLYKDPAPPSRLERQPNPQPAQQPSQKQSQPARDDRQPKSNTRNARSEGEARPPREPREPREPRPEGEQKPRKERAPRGDRPKGGDGKSVESTRVYVGNLSYDVTEQDLQELFKGIGGVRNVEIVYNRSTHRSKGYGFVEMLRKDEAVRAVEVLHDQPFMGRKMTVSGAKSKGLDEREDSEPETTPTKVVLAPLPPAAAAVAVAEEPAAVAAPVVTETTIPLVAEAAVQPVVEAAAEPAPQATEPAAETANDLVAKYGFDAPKEKADEA